MRTIAKLLAAAFLCSASSVTAASLYVTVQSPGKVVAVDEATGDTTDIVTSGLDNPRGIAFNPLNGDFYVADAPSAPGSYNLYDTLTIKRFSPGGVFLDSFGAGPSGNYGGGLAFDSGGNLYVAGSTADQYGYYVHGQIREYTAAGTFVIAGPSPVPVEDAFIPFQMGVDTSGNLLATDLHGAVWKYGPGLTSPALFAAPAGSPNGIAVGTNGNVYVGAPPSTNYTYDSSGAAIYEASSVGGIANVLGSDGYLYALRPPYIWRLNVPSGDLVSFSAFNTTSLPGAEWMAEAVVVPGNNGDLDDDGDVDSSDIDILWYIVRGSLADDPGSNDSEDLDGSGLVNEDDVDTMLGGKLSAGGGRRYGDSDIDSDVDGADFDAWRVRTGYAGPGTGTWAHGDFDGDGDVDGADFDLWRTRPAVFSTAVGPHSAAVSVPEPGAIVWLLSGALSVLMVRGRRRLGG